MPTFHEWQCRPAGTYFFAMLVSAAIDPYKKSYGNSVSRAAIVGGRTASERMTASPRKTCVPGVHACATAGATIRTRTATRAPAPMRRALHARLASDTKTLALPPNRSAEVLELRLDHVVDCRAG